MKNILIAAALCIAATMTVNGQTKLSILGDSYSTYGGYVSPEWNWCWYNGTDGGTDKQNDVTEVEQTWWHLLIEDMGWQLERNNSFSGSTVCCTGYSGADFSDRAFISRVNDLGTPDVIIVLGGTNDSWAKAPVGEYQYENWTKSDLYTFRPAFAYLLDRLTTLYPDATIINVVNSGLSDEITESQADICEHYGVKNLQLKNVDKQWGHPSIKGMRAIADQIKSVLPSE